MHCKFGIVTDELKLPPQEVIVVWDWEWRDPEEVTYISETSFGDVAYSVSDDPEKEDSDATCCSIPNKECNSNVRLLILEEE